MKGENIPMETKNIGVLLLAGSSTRTGGIKKQFYVSPHEEKPLYIHSLETLNKHLDDVVLVVGKGDKEKVEAQSYLFLKRVFPIVEGGETRTGSVYSGLQYIERIYGKKGINVLVHDAARPFLPDSTVEEIIRSLTDHDAVIPILKITDSLIRKERGKEQEKGTYLDRENVARVQTPQGFSFPLLLKAYENLLGESKTDDFQLVLPYAKSPSHIEGSIFNFKVTNPEDIRLYDEIIKARSEKK